ncbi:hypothetical protein B0H14DRAFT_3042138 [Mycena olivaceomarginata]|nr:hypothetical protein B0H14DRAFT_3042138 [Mycena olivaceomarginata]
MNPDMQGYIVRLSILLPNIGVAMLIAWSTKSPRSYYQLLFAQIFFILIGVLISIRRNQIIILTRSPICTYCVLFVLPRLFIKTLGVLDCQAIADGLCGGLILVLCLALDISVQLNGITRVYSSVQCGPGECWQAQGGRDAGTVRRWAALGVCLATHIRVRTVRHQKLTRHPSIKHRFHWKRVILFLALAPAVPVAWECVTLAISRRSQILQIPKLLLRDVVWIVSGRGESWRAEEELQLNDVWDAFPPDVLVVEPGLPTHARKPSATARNPRRRRRGGGSCPWFYRK